MIGRGVSTASIAEHMGVSVKTVETYRGNIKTKLNLKDGFELLKYAASWTERPVARAHTLSSPHAIAPSC